MLRVQGYFFLIQTISIVLYINTFDIIIKQIKVHVPVPQVLLWNLQVALSISLPGVNISVKVLAWLPVHRKNSAKPSHGYFTHF
jgi:hypothetical protein